jgi:hypothetical protein
MLNVNVMLKIKSARQSADKPGDGNMATPRCPGERPKKGIEGAGQ